MKHIAITLLILNLSVVIGLKFNQMVVKKAENSLCTVNRIVACGLLSILPFISISPTYALEQQYKLPPIDRKDPNRCVLTSSAMGQANAARDKLFDLRECDIKGQDGAGKDMSGVMINK